MSTLTATLGLTKPDTGQTFGDSWLIFNNNFDIIDAAVNNRVSKGSPVADLIGVSSTAGNVPIVAKGVLGQAANLFEARNNVDVVKASINASGQIFEGAARVYSSNNPPPGGAVSPLSLIANVASEVPLTLQGAASQSADILKIKNSGGTDLVKVGPTGLITGTQGAVIGGSTSFGAYLNIGIQSASAQGAIIRNATSQTANILEAQNSSGTLMSGFSASGEVIINNINSVTSARTAGAAAALPANPVSYLRFITHDGNVRYVACYS